MSRAVSGPSGGPPGDQSAARLPGRPPRRQVDLEAGGDAVFHGSAGDAQEDGFSVAARAVSRAARPHRVLRRWFLRAGPWAWPARARASGVVLAEPGARV